jgi:peptidoglycan/LPS O-acetylase OafA/YrhL
MKTQPNRNMNYRPEIDGLRAVAVLIVVFYHAGFDLFRGGFVGVDVFFVISGYLIARILLDEISQGGISYYNFIERRARRILPALFCMLIVVTPLALYFIPPDSLQSYGDSLLGATWFSSNFVFLSQTGYFDTSADLKPLLHTWSLAVEEQFYLFFPFLLSFLARKRKIMLGLFLGALFSLTISVWGLTKEASWPFFMFISRAWELGLGAIVAASSQSSLSHRIEANRVLGSGLPFIGFLLILISAVCFSNQTPTPGMLLLVPTLGAAMILMVPSGNNWTSKALSLPWMKELGLTSYALYLWHQPLLVFARFYFGGDINLWNTWAVLLASLVVAVISLRLIEKPFRDREVVPSKALFLALLGAAIVATLLGLMIKFVGEVRQRELPAAYGNAGHSEYYVAMDRRFHRCVDISLLYRIEEWEGVPRCHFFGKSDNTEVVFFGDSHAEQLFFGAAPLLSKSSIYLIRGGLPFFGEDRFRAPFEYLERSTTSKVVVFSAYWLEKISIVGPEAFSKRLFATIKWLLEKELKIVLMMDTPDFGFGPDRCVSPRPGMEATCTISSEKHRSSQGRYREFFEAISRHPSIELVDVSQSFCDEKVCNMTLNELLLFRDNDHLNVLGSDMAGQSLLERSNFLRKYIK